MHHHRLQQQLEGWHGRCCCGGRTPLLLSVLLLSLQLHATPATAASLPEGIDSKPLIEQLLARKAFLAEHMKSDEWKQHIQQQLAARSGPENKQGVLIVAGGRDMFANAAISLTVLRSHIRSSIPVEIVHFGQAELPSQELLTYIQSLNGSFAAAGSSTVAATSTTAAGGAAAGGGGEAGSVVLGPVYITDALAAAAPEKVAALHRKLPEGFKSFPAKVYALSHVTRFRKVLLLDADSMPLVDPQVLFKVPIFQRTGSLFWPDLWYNAWVNDTIYSLVGDMQRAPWVDNKHHRLVDSGQMLFDRERHAEVLEYLWLLNSHHEWVYKHMHGDKDTFLLAFSMAGRREMFSQVPCFTRDAMRDIPGHEHKFHHLGMVQSIPVAMLGAAMRAAGGGRGGSSGSGPAQLSRRRLASGEMAGQDTESASISSSSSTSLGDGMPASRSISSLGSLNSSSRSDWDGVRGVHAAAYANAARQAVALARRLLLSPSSVQPAPQHTSSEMSSSSSSDVRSDASGDSRLHRPNNWQQLRRTSSRHQWLWQQHQQQRRRLQQPGEEDDGSYKNLDGGVSIDEEEEQGGSGGGGNAAAAAEATAGPKVQRQPIVRRPDQLRHVGVPVFFHRTSFNSKFFPDCLNADKIRTGYCEVEWVSVPLSNEQAGHSLKPHMFAWNDNQIDTHYYEQHCSHINASTHRSSGARALSAWQPEQLPAGSAAAHIQQQQHVVVRGAATSSGAVQDQGHSQHSRPPPWRLQSQEQREQQQQQHRQLQQSAFGPAPAIPGPVAASAAQSAATPTTTAAADAAATPAPTAGAGVRRRRRRPVIEQYGLPPEHVCDKLPIDEDVMPIPVIRIGKFPYMERVLQASYAAFAVVREKAGVKV